MSEESKLLVNVFYTEKEEWQDVVLVGYGLDFQDGPTDEVHAEIHKRSIEFITKLAHSGVEGRIVLAAVPQPGGCTVVRRIQIRFAVPDAHDLYLDDLPAILNRTADAVYGAGHTETGFGPNVDRQALLESTPNQNQL